MDKYCRYIDAQSQEKSVARSTYFRLRSKTPVQMMAGLYCMRINPLSALMIHLRRQRKPLSNALYRLCAFGQYISDPVVSSFTSVELTSMALARSSSYVHSHLALLFHRGSTVFRLHYYRYEDSANFLPTWWYDEFHNQARVYIRLRAPALSLTCSRR